MTEVLATHIKFVEEHRYLKTSRYAVYAIHDGAFLGQVMWHGPWRQYVFYPAENTLWSVGCLQDVQGFIKGLMDARKPLANCPPGCELAKTCDRSAPDRCLPNEASRPKDGVD
jgi:hypothetical protein